MLTVTLAVPGTVIKAVVRVTCNWVGLVTSVVSVVPLITPTVDETKLLPFTVRTKPCWTWASVIVVAERDAMVGDGRALPHAGLRELQDWKTSKANKIGPKDRQKAKTRLMGHRSTHLPVLPCIAC